MADDTNINITSPKLPQVQILGFIEPPHWLVIRFAVVVVARKQPLAAFGLAYRRAVILARRADERPLRAGELPWLHKRELGWECQRIDRMKARGRIDASYAEGLHSLLETVRAEIKQLPGVHGKGFVPHNQNELVISDPQRQADACEARVMLAERVVVADCSWRADKNRRTRSHIDAECIGAAAAGCARRKGSRRGNEAVDITRNIGKVSRDLSCVTDVLGESAWK